MGSIKNTNKKLLIAIFTIPFLIGFIYSVYSQATSAQNNAVSSLESNSIIQEIINSSINGYSTAGQSLASFLSIKAIPAYVWTIITFLMTTLLFFAIYTYLFEIFVQRVKITESETMKKAKILFIFALSVFSAIAIGYAIPFLFNLYGLVLLILVIIALFFFGRAMISYGRSFHHSIKSFADDIEKNFLNAEKEVKIARFNAEKEVNEAGKQFSEKNIEILEEGIKRGNNIYNEIKKALDAANEKFKNILSKLIDEDELLINSLIHLYEGYLGSDEAKNLNDKQKEELKVFIESLKYLKDHLHNEDITPIRRIHDAILKYIQNNLELDDTYKQKLKHILEKTYNDTISQYKQILPEIQDAIKEYTNVKSLLTKFYQFEDAFKRDINSRLKYFFHAPGNRKFDIAVLSALEKSEKDIKEIENLVNDRLNILEDLLHSYLKDINQK